MESDKEATSATIEKYRKDLEEKQVELSAMQNSKKTFGDRAGKGDVSKWGSDFLRIASLSAGPAELESGLERYSVQSFGCSTSRFLNFNFNNMSHSKNNN